MSTGSFNQAEEVGETHCVLSHGASSESVAATEQPTPKAGGSAPRKGKTRPAKNSQFTGMARRAKKDAGLEPITRQTWVHSKKDITELPSDWDVPTSEESTAFVVDLSNREDERQRDIYGRLLSVSQLITDAVCDFHLAQVATLLMSEFRQCTDSWKGSGGHKNKPSVVEALKGVPARKTKQDCQGVFHCDQVDPTF